MRVQYRPQAVAGLRPLLDESPPMSAKRPQLTHLHGWHPHAWQHAYGQQACQGERVTRISLDPRLGDQRDLDRVSHRHRGHQRNEHVIEVPGIAGSLERHDIRSSEVFANPLVKVVEVDPSRR